MKRAAATLLTILCAPMWSPVSAQGQPALSCSGKTGQALSSCRQQIAQDNARRLSQGLPPLSDTASDPGQQARQALSKKLVPPVPAAPATMTASQKAEAARNPKLAAEWALKSQAALNDTSGLKELTPAQVFGLIKAAQKEVLIISTPPDKASIEAINLAAQKSRVTLIIPSGSAVNGLSTRVVVRRLPLVQNGQVQGVTLVDSRVMVLGNLSEKGRFSGTNNPNVTYSMQDNLQQLLKRAFP